MNYSKQRELVLQAVLENPIHPTADGVYQQVRQQNPRISLGTVYRNLNFLAEMGMIRKISMPVGSDRFDGRLDQHDHMVVDPPMALKKRPGPLRSDDRMAVLP